jgi:hypothetical protein
MKHAHTRVSSGSAGAANRGAVRPARVQTKASVGAGNHRRQRYDSYERQADDMARRIVRGETNVGRHILPVAAASYRVAGSQGMPIDAAVRERLEAAFGADFRAVRIHTDAVSDSAAHALGAAAFTSGRHIHFQRSRYAPNSGAGLDLLAHELTHTLQQTGRTGSDGRLRVIDVQGEGAPQTKRTSPLISSSTIPDFDQVADRHRTAAPSDKTLGAKIDQIKRERNDAIKGNRLEGYWDTLDSYVRSHPDEYHEASSPITVRSFIYDCLKLAKRWDGAAYLLIRDWDLQTTFFASEVYEAYPDGAVPGGANNLDANDYVLGFWNVLPFYAKFRPKRFLEATGDYLTGPSRSIQDLDVMAGNFSGVVDAELATRDAPPGLVNNELYFVGLHFVREIDRIRIAKTAEFARAAAGGKSVEKLTPQERALAAQKLATWAHGLPLDKSYTGEIAAALAILAGPLENVATAAVNFWSIARTIVDAATQGLVLPKIGDVKAGLAEFAKRPAVVAFLDRLAAGATDLFKLDTDGNPIAPKDYAAARDAFVGKINEKLFERFEQPMLQAIRSSNDKDILVSLLYGWMFLQVTDLVALLQTYNAADDADLMAKYGALVPGYAGADMRIRHRIQVARFLNGLDGVFHWQKLRDAIAPVFAPAKDGKTLLAIFTDFSADTDKIAKLTEDFAGGSVITGAEPLTMADIRNFFWLQRSTTLAAALKAGIDAEKAKPGSQPYGIVKRALDAADALPKPMRYVTHDFYASVREEDRGYFSPIVRAHPKFIKLRQDKTKNGLPPITLVPLGFNDGELVVWTLPAAADYDKLVKRFQDIESFNELIYTWETLESGGTLEVKPDLSAIAKRPYQDWLRAFNHALEKQYPWIEKRDNEKESAELLDFYQNELKAADGAHEKLRTDFLDQQTQTMALLREASVIDRVKKSDELVKILNQYDRYNQFSVASDPKVVIYQIPDLVLDEIIHAIHLTGPESDQPLHQTVLMLELAEAMAKNLQDSPRLDVMVGYLALIDPAIDMARNKADQLTPVLTDAEKQGDWVAQRATTLEALARLFHGLQQQQQLDYGLRAVVNGPDKYLVDVQGGYLIKPGETFMIDGITYTIVDIKQSFAYYPRHGTEKAKLVDDKDAPLSMSAPLVEVRYGESTTTKILRGSDEELMSQLSMAVTLEAIVRQLNDLAAFMQGAMELTMDIVELIPGPGQALMAARLAMSILQFIASDEFSVLVDFVTNHPVEALEKFGKEIFALLNPGMLWEFLFFGNNVFDQLHATKAPPKNAKVPHTMTEKLTRVIMRLYNFGAGVLGSLGRLQTHTRWRAEQMQLFVLDHPALEFVVRLLADNIDYLADVVGEAVAFGGNLDEYREQAAKALTEWPDRVFETVNTLRQFELPDEIIPMSDVVEIIVTMVLKRLPTKFRIAADVIMFLLDKFGKKQGLMDTIADGVKSIGVDPNIPWRAVRDEYLEKPFHEARNELAAKIFELFGSIPTTINTGVAGQFALVTPDQQKKFQDAAAAAKSDSDFEVTSVPADVWGFTAGTSVRNPKPLALPRGSGTPLSRTLRGPAESGFGRDFSHVRLHRDDAAASFTRSVGAKALAGGSHIYLSPQVNPATQSGRWIVNHELAHVAQQVPPTHSGSRPIPVARGHGLAHDPFAERAASRAADAVSGSIPRFVDPGAFAGRGLQPFGLIDITRRLLDDLAGTADVEHDEEKEEKTGGSTGLKKLPPNIKSQIDKLWDTFGEALNKKTTFKSPFDQAKQLIIDHLTNKADPDKPAKALEEALGDLAIDSVREKKKPASGKEPEKITYELDIDRFEVALSRFVFAKSGIMVKFKLLSGIFAGAASGAKDEPPSFQTLNVVYVHLPEIHGNSKLWQNATSTVLGSKSHDQYFPRIRSYLEGKGPSLGVWDSTSYQLKSSVIDAVDAMIAAAQAGTLDKSLLPPPTEYLNPKLPSGAAANIGLRLGVYGDAEQQGQERESHHITQYLLLEYFNNKCDDYKPFPLLKNSALAYPGVKASGSGNSARVQTFTAPKAAKPIQISAWEDGRGGKMPAILLATPTHRTGRLHVTTKADDWTQGGAKASAPDSPAAVVNLKFRENLRAVDQGYLKAQDKSTGLSVTATQESFADYVKRKNAAQPGAVQDVIYTAMQDTYHWMRDFMQPRLEDALVTIERKYYNDLGKDKHYEITDTELKAVFAEAVIKNETEMKNGGWI